ncbi:MAG: quinolinate synthase NadA [Candidatus Diapherotrites archaeon]|nr:quinolinate synthase NadA [Candidatus Diapherotrites archaeon]
MIDEVMRLKEEEGAVILAHNYQRPEIQDIADFVGDSLDLALKSRELSSELIIFCGVRFMAETAAILNPEKTVLLPNTNALCPMAAQLTPELIKQTRKTYGDAPVVLYVNTTAECKAEADICCTSANAVKVVNSLDADTVIFGPDKNLAYHISKNTDKTIISVPDNGHCATHKFFITYDDIMSLKYEHKNAVVMVHPECNPDVQDVADYILGTNGMVREAKRNKATEFIIGTEKELCYRMRKEIPGKQFFCIDNAICQDMKKITLQDVYQSLIHKRNVVAVEKTIAERAREAIEAMLAVK